MLFRPAVRLFEGTFFSSEKTKLLQYVWSGSRIEQICLERESGKMWCACACPAWAGGASTQQRWRGVYERLAIRREGAGRESNTHMHRLKRRSQCSVRTGGECPRPPPLRRQCYIIDATSTIAMSDLCSISTSLYIHREKNGDVSGVLQLGQASTE